MKHLIGWCLLLLACCFPVSPSYSSEGPSNPGQWSCGAASPRGFHVCLGGSDPWDTLEDAEDEALRSCEVGCEEKCLITSCIFY